MKRILFLASGGGGNFKFFHQAIQRKYLDDVQLSVVADRKCGSIEYAEKWGLDSTIINYTRTAPNELRYLLAAMKPDVIVTNWHKIIDADTVRDNLGKLVNLHYSLLPAFGGLIGIEPIKKAYEQGCKFVGPTCHLVDEGVDTGRIIAQAVFATDRPMQEAVTMMFRTGCLVLLNGIQSVLDQELITHTGISETIFSPPLNFDHAQFSDDFWRGVAEG